MSQERADYFHERAATSSFEARGRAMNLSAAGIAGLFLLITSDDFSASETQKALIVLSACFLALSIGSGVFNSYADAQWAYYRATLLDPALTATSNTLERKWHRLKVLSEVFTQMALVAGVLLAAIILIMRVADLPIS